MRRTTPSTTPRSEASPLVSFVEKLEPMIEPIGHLEMLYAVCSAELVLTDSGGLQEETTVLGVPCITIRENTKRPVTVDIGMNNMVGTDPEKIKSVAYAILSGQGKKGAIPPLWDGNAAERIAAVFLINTKDKFFGRK